MCTPNLHYIYISGKRIRVGLLVVVVGAGEGGRGVRRGTNAYITYTSQINVIDDRKMIFTNGNDPYKSRKTV